MIVVGLTGQIASGKDVFAEMLVEKGFIRLKLSDIIISEIKKRGMTISRTVLQDIGNELRKKNGNGYLAKTIIEMMEEGNNYVITGIRNPGEVEELRKLRNFFLIGVTAPIEMRLDWIKERGQHKDPKSIEEIRVIDERDRGIGEEEHGQRSSDCLEMADATIYNNTNLDDLREKAAQLLEQMGLG